MEPLFSFPEEEVTEASAGAVEPDGSIEAVSRYDRAVQLLATLDLLGEAAKLRQIKNADRSSRLYAKLVDQYGPETDKVIKRAIKNEPQRVVEAREAFAEAYGRSQMVDAGYDGERVDFAVRLEFNAFRGRYDGRGHAEARNRYRHGLEYQAGRRARPPRRPKQPRIIDEQ